MPRLDITDKVIHFTGPQDNWEEAYRRLKAIINDQKLIAGNGMIRGSYFCVCFTEAPLSSLSGGFINPLNFSRYAPFGIMFNKTWIFERGGRPVIYQPDAEYDILPTPIRWRHVRYEPTSTPPIDFTWERERRIRCEELPFLPNEVGVIVPNQGWANRLRQEHEDEQDYYVKLYSTAVDEFIAEAFRENFPWRVYYLGV